MGGIYKQPPKMVGKISEYIKGHPKAKIKEVAKALGCDPSYVWQLNNIWGIGVNVNQITRLTPEEEKDIRRKCSAGWKIKDICEYYNISDPKARKVCKGIKTLSHRWTINDDIVVARMSASGASHIQIAEALQLRVIQVRNRRLRLKYMLQQESWLDILMTLLSKKRK